MNNSDSEADKARPVVLVGAGERAQAWLEPLRRSSRLRVVATVQRGAASVAPDLPDFASIEEALAGEPKAAFAVALPPRSGLAASLVLARAARESVVEAPLDDALCEAQLGVGAARVRVAHGWTTLRGARAVGAILRRVGSGKLFLDMAGLPEQAGGDVGEVLIHAAALVRFLLPDARPIAAHSSRGELRVALESGSAWQIDLRLRPHGQSVCARVEGGVETALWQYEEGRESVVVGETALIAPNTPPPAAVRALAQLIPDAQHGDDLRDAAKALRLAAACRALMPSALPVSARRLRQSASVASRRPEILLDRLGLSGVLPRGAGIVRRLDVDLPEEPFELWAFRAGIKPVVFLTVLPQDVESTLSHFGEVHCEQRERLVEVAAQDRWTDKRDRGEPRVELYISRDADLAKRAAYLQAEADPSDAIRELGELVGYPSCCVAAFADQDDRSNNTGNRYQSFARTIAADGSSATPWPWELNNLHTMVAPFYPCSYSCEEALSWSRSALTELGRVHTALATGLRENLAQPVLYFDHEHQLVLAGESDGELVSYRGVQATSAGGWQWAALVSAVAKGDRLRLSRTGLEVTKGRDRVLELQRIDPALGLIAPFGDAANLVKSS